MKKQNDDVTLSLMVFVIFIILAIISLSGFKFADKKAEGKRTMAREMYILGNDMHTILITKNEVDLIERVVQAEAGGESYRCQEAVAQVILNRWLCEDYFPDTITEVIEQDNQFCTPATYSTVGVRIAVYDAITYYNTNAMHYPKTMYYFRADHYHDFGIPYTNIDNTYFSLSDKATD